MLNRPPPDMRILHAGKRRTGQAGRDSRLAHPVQARKAGGGRDAIRRPDRLQVPGLRPPGCGTRRAATA